MRVLPLVLLLCILGVSPSASQQFTWPERAVNLKVLPPETTAQTLSATMIGFSQSLGVRCPHCHVGEEGAPLTTFDFASDEKPAKQTARAMLEMLGDINESLDAIEPSGTQRVNMGCHTCHAGRPRPFTLREELSEVASNEGAMAAIDHYQTLRQRFYGRGAYDFGEEQLDAFGFELMGQGDLESALVVFELNAEQFPESARAYASWGEAMLQSGDRGRAIELYRKALELNPRLQSAKAKLAELEGE